MQDVDTQQLRLARERIHRHLGDGRTKGEIIERPPRLRFGPNESWACGRSRSPTATCADVGGRAPVRRRAMCAYSCPWPCRWKRTFPA